MGACLALLALAWWLCPAAPALAAHDWVSAPADWRFIELRGPAKVAASTAQDGTALELKAVSSGMCVVVLAAGLGKAGNMPERVALRFEYQGGNGGMPLSATLSAGFGWAAPYIRFTPTRCGNEWRTSMAVADLAGFPPDSDVVVQFWIVGQVTAGQWVRVRAPALASAPRSEVDVRLASPGGGVLVAGGEGESLVLGLRSLGSKRDFIATLRTPEGESLLTAKTEVRGRGSLALDASNLAPGGYVVEVEAGPEGKRYAFPLRKVPARPGQVVIRNGAPEVDGKPFFIIGLYHVGDPVISIINRENERLGLRERLTRKSLLSQVKSRRFNTVLYPWALAPSDFYADARSAGLMVVSGSSTTRPAEAAALAKKNPAVFGFYAVDEPTASDAERAESDYRAYKAKDPWNPVMTAIDNGCVGFGPARFVDAAMPDSYPISGPDSDVSNMALFVRNCRRVLFGNDPTATVIAVPQLFTLDNERWKGFQPTYAQVRAQVYTALAAGAKGIMYYAYYTHEPLAGGMPANPERTHWYLPESPLWDKISALNKELAKLGLILATAKDIPGAETLDPDLAVGLFRSGNKAYLVAANPLPRPRKGRRVSLPVKAKSAFPVVGSPLARVKGANLFIDFPAYGAGAWRLEESP